MMIRQAMTKRDKYKVIVQTKRGYPIALPRYFSDYQKARDYYTDCLMKYLDCEVEFNKEEQL